MVRSASRARNAAQIPARKPPPLNAPIQHHIHPVVDGDIAQTAPDKLIRSRDGVVDIEPVRAALFLPFHILRAQSRRFPKAVILCPAAQGCALLRP